MGESEIIAIPLYKHSAKQDNSSMAKNKNASAVALGKLGGKARAASLSHAERSEIASKAGKARSQKLSTAHRRRIALLGVAARERKRKERKNAKVECPA